LTADDLDTIAGGVFDAAIDGGVTVDSDIPACPRGGTTTQSVH
jgi:hypothetical protein